MIAENPVIHHFGNRDTPLGGIGADDWQFRRPRWKQVHGIAVAEVEFEGQDLGEVDAVWTRRVGQPIAVVTADCVPILLERRDSVAVAALHAGWRGTAGRMIESFFRALPSDLADPKDWMARIGPSIRACCYQVSGELVDQFGATFSGMPRKAMEPVPRMLDLVAVNQFELERLQVELASIHPDCTFCAAENGNPVYFSYRRGDRNSRQYSMIFLSSKK